MQYQTESSQSKTDGDKQEVIIDGGVTMAHNFFYPIVMLLIGAASFGFGINVRNRKRPMWVWTWDKDKLNEDTISDVTAYNHAVGKMYCFYAVPCVIIAILEFVNPEAALLVFGITCTLGIALMVWGYHRIERKYRK